MAEFRDQTFRNVRLDLDGNTFTGCTLDGCTLVFAGVGDVRLVACTIQHCMYSFQGPAQRTLQFLHALYHNGSEQDDGDRTVVEGLFDDIRSPRPQPGGPGPV